MPDSEPMPGFDALMNTEYLEFGEDFARARVPISPQLLQPYGLVHGGVYCAIAESLASRTTGQFVTAEGRAAVGLSNHTSFLRVATEGTLHADARARHRGRRTWVWDVDISDDRGRLCATSRVTLAVIDPPEPSGSESQPE